MPRCAHRAMLSGVDVDVGVRAATVWKDVDVRQRIIGTRAGAAGAPRARVKRGELAVCGHARLHCSKCGWAIAGGEMLFLAIEHQLHRRAGRLGEPRAEQALDVWT